MRRTLLNCCVVSLALVLCGCRGVPTVTVFNDLPESHYLDSFKSALNDKKPIAVSFTANWCPHCQKYKPVFYDVGGTYEKKVTFINVDVESDAGRVLSERFQVKGIPTTAFIRKDGSVFRIQVGEIEKEELQDITESLLKSKKKKKDEPIAPFPINSVIDINSDSSKLN